MINKAELLIISRYLRPKNKDSFLKVISNFSFIGIILGVSTLIVVMSVMNGFRIELLDKLLSYQPHVSMQTNGNYTAEKKNILELARKNKIEINHINIVNNSEALIVTKKNNYGVLIKGFDDKEIKNNYFLKNSIIKGKVDAKNIGIGSELASKLSVSVGDIITLLSNNTESTPFGVVPKQFNFEIGYVFNTGMFEFDNNFMIINLSKSKLISKKRNEIEIKLNNPDQSIFLTTLLKKEYPNSLVFSWINNNKTFFDALQVERNVMFIILTLIIVVAAFNIISVLTILIKNKSKEIAILRSLGFNKSSIMRIFIFTGSMIGVLGTVFGILLGVVLSNYLENIRLFLNKYLNINVFPSEIYFLSNLPSHINYNSVIYIALFSISIVIIASFFPSLNASKLDPIKNLKND